LHGARQKRSFAAREISAARDPEPTSAELCRHLTVMFCDLVGSTALSTRYDPEDLRAIISCTELVR
jgi:class 3 adenylate cyclase